MGVQVKELAKGALDDPIVNLYLSIRLWMVRQPTHMHHLQCSQQVTKVTKEFSPIVSSNKPRDTVLCNNVSVKPLSQDCSCPT